MKKGVKVLFSAYCLSMLYISTTFHENIFLSIKVIDGTRYPYKILQNKHNSVNNLGGVMDLVFCMASDVLYLYQDSQKYLKA